MKRYFSIPLRAMLGLAVFFVGANVARFVAYDAQNWYRGYYWKKAQAEYERPFREDKIGGATPEQTWEMFISALEAGEVEKASTFFHVKTREEEKKRLIDKQTKNELTKFVDKLKGINNSKQIKKGTLPNEIYFVFKEKQESDEQVVLPDDSTHLVPAGEYEGRIEFFRNSNNVWKIYKL